MRSRSKIAQVWSRNRKQNHTSHQRSSVPLKPMLSCECYRTEALPLRTDSGSLRKQRSCDAFILSAEVPTCLSPTAETSGTFTEGSE